MKRTAGDEEDVESVRAERQLPAPSLQFRQRAWREFQKALDPLAPPKALPTKLRKPQH